MKKLIILLFLILPLPLGGCEDTDVTLLVDAGIDAVRAVSLSEEEVAELSAQAINHMDSDNSLAPPDSPYAKRLARLLEQKSGTEGRYEVRVYLKQEVNAFAMGDGSIRIYSGLMDMMDDNELLFVIGHEMGHVAKDHVRKKMQVAYAGSAIRKGLASQNNAAGAVAASLVGGFAQKLINAQFSQHEEREADDYGLAYLKRNDLNGQAAVGALQKLATLGKGHSFLSSHPAPGQRAARLEAVLLKNV